MNIYERYGLRRIINASGKMTALGASAVTPEIGDALKEAAMDYVNMDELLVRAGQEIAKATGAADGCPTAGAAPGIAISVAAVIARDKLSLIEKLPDSSGLKNEVVLQKGHSVHFGASISQMIALGGGRVVEVGQANHTGEAHIEEAIGENTAALFYVKSHHAIQKGMQSVETMAALAKRYGISLIIDAAAEENMQKYIALGADLAIYSGGKALGGPTSGFVCGRADLIRCCRLQYKGIGRAMKVGKEGMLGLMAALSAYNAEQDDSQDQIQRMTWLIQQLDGLSGVQGEIAQDESGRAIYRAQLSIDPAVAGKTAIDVIRELELGNPGIFTRNYYAAQGKISIDPRPLLPGQEAIIVGRIKEIILQNK